MVLNRRCATYAAGEAKTYEGLTDYLMDFTYKCIDLLTRSQIRADVPTIRHEILIDTTDVNPFDLVSVVSSAEKRRDLIAHGAACVAAAFPESLPN
jgi:hypothetical protein